jgi:hypothetical protein
VLLHRDRQLAGWIDRTEQNLSKRLTAILPGELGMKQSRHPINPGLNVKAAVPVQYDDRPRVNLRHILNQRILLFRKAERAIMAFTLVLLVCP